MDENELYLDLAAKAYLQGVTSDAAPAVLQGLAGPFALAGLDAESTRFDKGRLLGFVDWLRSPDERRRVARSNWWEHDKRIRRLMHGGLTARDATTTYVTSLSGRTGSLSLADLRNLTNEGWGEDGVRPIWLSRIADLHDRFANELDVVGNTIPAVIGATEYLVGRVLKPNEDPDVAFERAVDSARGWQAVTRPLEALMAPFQNRTLSPPPQRARLVPESHERRIERSRGTADRGIDTAISGSRDTDAVRSPAATAEGDRRQGPLVYSRQPSSWREAPAAPAAKGSSKDARPVRERGRNRTHLERAELFADPTEERAYVSKLARDERTGKVLPRTMEALADIFRRSSGFTLGGEVITFLQSRAAAGELMQLVRLLKDPDVISVEILPSSKGGVSPDFRLTVRASLPRFGNQVTTACEVATCTRASLVQKPAKTTGQPTRPAPQQPVRPGSAAAAVVRKATGGQIADGGVVAVNSLFNPRDVLTWAKSEVEALNSHMDAKGVDWPHLHSITFSAIDDAARNLRKSIEAIRLPSGRYAIPSQSEPPRRAPP